MPRKATRPVRSAKAIKASDRSAAPPRRKPATRKSATVPGTKAAAVLAALQQPAGATLAELATLTGWQPHSVRGHLSGTVRKQATLVAEVTERGRVYRARD